MTQTNFVCVPNLRSEPIGWDLACRIIGIALWDHEGTIMGTKLWYDAELPDAIRDTMRLLRLPNGDWYLEVPAAVR
jgi:hypothetical protein